MYNRRKLVIIWFILTIRNASFAFSWSPISVYWSNRLIQISNQRKWWDRNELTNWPRTTHSPTSITNCEMSEIIEGCQNNIHTADDWSIGSLRDTNLPEVTKVRLMYMMLCMRLHGCAYAWKHTLHTRRNKKWRYPPFWTIGSLFLLLVRKNTSMDPLSTCTIDHLEDGTF